MNNLNTLVDTVLKDTNYSTNPYFVNLKKGLFAKEDFTETQIQFYFAVIFFNRPMAALAAKIPSQKARLGVLKNIWEEHGEGKLSQAHGNTFLRFLNELAGIDIKQVQYRGLWPEIRIFNTALVGISVHDDYLVSTSAFGIIERMFSEISSWIRNGVIQNKWIPESKISHYTTHSELDITHSQDFFDILKEPFAKNDENKYFIEQGLRFGAVLFNNLYLELWNNRKRRWMLEKPFPPSKAST